MKIVIAGAGTVGKNIINNFIKAGHEIVVIDKSKKSVFDISGIENVEIIIGNACNPEVLQQADVQNAAGFIAVTNSDAVNVISCNLAKILQKSPITMARIRSDFLYNDESNKIYFKETYSIDHLLNSGEEIAQKLYNILRYNDIYDYAEMEDIAVTEVRCKVGSDISNTPLRHMKNMFPDIDMKIISILREGKSIQFPVGNDIILENDIVYVATHKADVNKVLAAFGVDSERRKIAIIGINNVTKCLLNKLGGYEVTVIDSSSDKMQFITSLDIERRLLDNNTLKELVGVDTLVSATSDDEQNVLLSLTARKLGFNRVIAFSNDKYNSLISPEENGVIVDFKHSVFSKILDILYVDEYIPLKHNEMVISIFDVPESSPSIGNTISHVLDSSNIMPIFVRAGEAIEMIDKNYVIRPKDRLILIMPLETLKQFSLE